MEIEGNGEHLNGEWKFIAIGEMQKIKEGSEAIDVNV